MTIPSSTPTNTTPSAQAIASANSVVRMLNSRRSSARSRRLIDAAMMTALRTACGIAWTRPGTNRSIAIKRAAATRPVNWVFAPDWNATAVRELLVLTGKPRTCRPQGWRSRSLRAPDCRRLRSPLERQTRPDTEIVSPIATSEMPTAEAKSSGMSAAGTAGKLGQRDSLGQHADRPRRRAPRDRARSTARSRRRPRPGFRASAVTVA